MLAVSLSQRQVSSSRFLRLAQDSFSSHHHPQLFNQPPIRAVLRDRQEHDRFLRVRWYIHADRLPCRAGAVSFRCRSQHCSERDGTYEDSPTFSLIPLAYSPIPCRIILFRCLLDSSPDMMLGPPRGLGVVEDRGPGLEEVSFCGYSALLSSPIRSAALGRQMIRSGQKRHSLSAEQPSCYLAQQRQLLPIQSAQPCPFIPDRLTLAIRRPRNDASRKDIASMSPAYGAAALTDSDRGLYKAG